MIPGASNPSYPPFSKRGDALKNNSLMSLPLSLKSGRTLQTLTKTLISYAD